MRHTKSMLAASAIALFTMPTFAEKTMETEKIVPKVSVNHDYTRMMLNLEEDITGKPLRQLQFRQSELDNYTLYLGAQFRVVGAFETTNKKDKFPLLTRFPQQHFGKTGSNVTLNDFTFATTANVSSWITGYAQFSFRQAYENQTNLQIRKAFLTFGDLNEYPLYLSIGRNAIDFGRMDTFAATTQTMTNHFFFALSTDPTIAVGYYKDGFHAVLTGINGGRQIRVADSANRNHFSNFALNASYTYDSEVWGGHIGAGYLHGSLYRAAIASHTANDLKGKNNGVVDINAGISYKNFHLMGEFASTLRKWPATKNHVFTFNVDAAYDFMLSNHQARVFTGFSHGRIGQKGTQAEFMNQFVFGGRYNPISDLFLSAEYVLAQGFVPLAGMEKSDRGVVSHTILLGVKYLF